MQRRVDDTCQGTVSEAIIVFLDPASWEDAVRNAVSLGGDSDTLACITGGIAEAWYGGVPAHVQQHVMETLPADLGAIVRAFLAHLAGGRRSGGRRSGGRH